MTVEFSDPLRCYFGIICLFYAQGLPLVPAGASPLPRDEMGFPKAGYPLSLIGVGEFPWGQKDFQIWSLLGHAPSCKWPSQPLSFLVEGNCLSWHLMLVGSWFGLTWYCQRNMVWMEVGCIYLGPFLSLGWGGKHPGWRCLLLLDVRIRLSCLWFLPSWGP